ncbi:hypothetical protein CGMCC3_g18010 [Colletotrichum fructicola]|nr:uncharacterized protein CGMCC3_g18010 [Colletotrichum fructicola]KAE9565810.1 hypothetical protein CGMCC3_g18010 [Colletotrichum fructicola]
MTGAVGGGDEVIRITIVDFLSGKTLLDNLVNPSRPITNWREKITGVSADRMREAVERNEALAICRREDDYHRAICAQRP